MGSLDSSPCRSCRRPLPRSGTVCQACGVDQRSLRPPPPLPPPPTVRRSVLVAAGLSVLCPGLGHLYAGDTATAGLILAWVVLLVVMALTVVGLLLAVPAWLVTVPVATVLAAATVREGNRRLAARG